MRKDLKMYRDAVADISVGYTGFPDGSKKLNFGDVYSNQNDAIQVAELIKMLVREYCNEEEQKDCNIDDPNADQGGFPSG